LLRAKFQTSSDNDSLIYRKRPAKYR
jgi:hypothetical protein